MQTNGLTNAMARTSRLTLALKRAFDVVVSAAAIVVLAPLFCIVGIAIKLDSPGPVFFRQVRVGRGGRPFRIFKFRSMGVDAERKGSALTVDADPRITKVGGFLRDHKIDELPQLFNVLAGTMSFVGPRPEVPEYMEFYTPEQRDIILSIRPGITDYAAILFRDESRLLDGSADPVETYRREIMPVKFKLYDRYSHDVSLLRDIQLIIATIALLISSRDFGWFDDERTIAVAASSGRTD